jgi:hypothetical protein
VQLWRVGFGSRGGLVIGTVRSPDHTAAGIRLVAHAFDTINALDDSGCPPAPGRARIEIRGGARARSARLAGAASARVGSAAAARSSNGRRALARPRRGGAAAIV